MKSELTQLNELKDLLQYYKGQIPYLDNEVKVYIEGEKLNKWICEHWVIELRNKAIKDNALNIIETEKEITQLESEINLKLKHFKADIPNLSKGKLLIILDKLTYHNGDKSKIYKYYELVDKVIKEKLSIEFSYKLINKYLNYTWMGDTIGWV